MHSTTAAGTGSDGAGATQHEPPAKKPVLHIDFPPVKEREEVLREQQAAVQQEDLRKGMESEVPPVIRSVLELAHQMMSAHSQWLRATPGFQGGLFYKGKPYCFASGFRDSRRPRDMDEKGNHMKLKDPLVYGTLSLPVTAAYLCELHGKGVFDLERPLAEYLPDLREKLDESVTARSILSFTTVLDDATVLSDAGASPLRPLISLTACASTQVAVYTPINRFLAGGSASQLNGKQQRENLVQYIRSAPRITGLLKCPLGRGHISHFSVALLIAAVESQLKDVNFEKSIRTLFFERAQSHGSSYGPPKLWRDPNELFYQPTGLAMQHQTFGCPVAEGDTANCGPPVFNASMNLHAPVEDYGKLLMLSLDTIMDAREMLGTPTATKAHYDFGVECLPGKSMLQLHKKFLRVVDYLPSASSFRYNSEVDLGCFAVTSCGSRSARLFADTLSRLIQHLFVKHVLEQGIEADEPPDLNNPTKSQGDTEEKFKKVMEANNSSRYFNKRDEYKRF